MNIRLLLLISPLYLFSQITGIKGKVIDKDFQEPLPFANVVIINTGDGTTTDFDGVFSIELSPGTYEIEVSFVGFQKQKITDIEVEAGSLQELNFYLKSIAEEFDEVVITADVLRNTEQSVLAVQKKSANLLDGLSSQNFKKIGASDLSSALKSVPGVSVQDGGFVYVRGLGDRYTKTLINGIEIPGLDPDRNTIQLDIFPTSSIDQVIVLKSATADLPADFTGGIIDVVTKDIPSNKSIGFSVSTSFNPNMNLSNNYLSQKRSSSDWIGLDDGLRNLPFPVGTQLPYAIDRDPALTDATNSFNKQLRGDEIQSGLNYSGNLSYGNSYDFGSKKIGVITNFSLNKSFSHYDDSPTFFFQREKETSVNNLTVNRQRNGPLSSENNLATGLLGLSLKGKKSKYKFNVLRLQNANASSGSFLEQRFIGAVSIFDQSVLFFNEKTVTNSTLSGKHFLINGRIEIDWDYSRNRNTFKDKDIRITALTKFRLDAEDYEFDVTESGAPQRIWRDLNEIGQVAKADIKFNYKFNEKPANLKLGVYRSSKNRDYYIESYMLGNRGRVLDVETGDVNNILSPANIYDSDAYRGTYYFNNSSASNTYESSQIINATYLSNELQLLTDLRVILGLRFENFSQKYKGSDFEGNKIDKRTILKNNIFPSANLVYALNDNSNLRTSYAKTIARPSFKESSNAEIYDPTNDTFFIGNLDVQPSFINNFDIRYENFSGSGDMIAISTFYKNAEDPIEIVTYAPYAPDNFIARNVETVDIFGAELEIRKRISQNFKVRFNGSLINSRMRMGDVEFESRKNNARDGETIDRYRDLQGQSPYLINTAVEYQTADNNLFGSLFYNVQGKTLQVVGVSNVPDIYTMPFNSLNMRVEKKFGVDRKTALSLKINNILNDTRRSEFVSHGIQSDYFFSRLEEGITFSLGFSRRF